MRRGIVRLLLLKLLVEQERHGYDLLRYFSEQGWGPGPGSIYPTLGALEEEGLVAGRDEDGKRVYKITEQGLAYLHQYGERFKDWFEELSEAAPDNRVRQALSKLEGAASQAARGASEAGLDQVVAILDRARKEIYAVLASE